MQVLVCPRCRRTNPGVAVFCYYDGAELQAHVDGAGASAQNRLAREFVFPSGRRCQTFDELVLGCQEEWNSARDLLRQGVFNQFFMVNGRADLAKATQDAQAQPDPDIALIRFVNALPVSKALVPRLDLNPRRLLLGNLLAGESRQVQLTVSNQGQGILQGTLKVTEGGQWLHLMAEGAQNGQCALRTARDQQITLKIETRGLAAAQTYGAKLTVITNGGVVEVPVRMDLLAHPFGRQPFHGIKTPREMAERMRGQPKAAVPLLESGEIARWFSGNGWNYPVRGTPARGVAGVQQFFEAMGLSKPPQVQVAQPEVRFACTFPESQRYQVALHTASRKWVYANVESDSPWLKVLTPVVSGPQQAAIAFEVNSQALPAGRAEGRLNIVANAGQTLSIKVAGEVRGAPGGKKGGFLQAVLAMVLACFILRLLLVPVADLVGRGSAAHAAALRVGQAPAPDSPLNQVGGWLRLPWGKILMGSQPDMPAKLINPSAGGTVPLPEFGHYFVSYLLQAFVLWLWWVGALLGMIIMWRRGEGARDVIWGLIAGAVAGAAGSATVACLVLVVEILPAALIGGDAGIFQLALWILAALATWSMLGLVLGIVFALAGPLRRAILYPVQNMIARIFRLCGLKGLAVSFSRTG